MSYVHFLGDVGRGKVDDDLLMLDFGEGEVDDEVVDLFLDEFVLHLYLQEALFVGMDGADVFILEEALTGFASELHHCFAAESGAFLLVPMHVEFLHS